MRSRHVMDIAKKRCRVLRLAVLTVLAAVACVLCAPRMAWASPKDECIEAHGRGQDQREKGQLVRARQTFLSCAQSGCPNLIQGDCARFGEELSRLVPSVSFAARDARGGDLPGTTVYVDDTLVATRLDDGKSYDVDPGKHLVRFVHEDRETSLKLVLNQGERGRSVVATFADVNPAPLVSREAPAASVPGRPVLPLFVAGVGAAAVVTGGVILALGLHEVPSSCSVSSKDCAAAPGDPAFASASHGVSLANVGVGVGIGGAAAMVGGLVWYFTQSTDAPPTQTGKRGRLEPWVGRGSGGVAAVGTF